MPSLPYNRTGCTLIHVRPYPAPESITLIDFAKSRVRPMILRLGVEQYSQSLPMGKQELTGAKLAHSMYRSSF